MAIVKCWDCSGTGYKDYYRRIDNGVCYTCLGTGVWNENVKLTPLQEERKRIAQEKRDKFRLMELHNELKELGRQLTPIVSEYTFSYATRGVRAPKELDDKMTDLMAQLKKVTIEGYYLQKKVKDVTFIEFRDAYLKYDELNKK